VLRAGTKALSQHDLSSPVGFVAPAAAAGKSDFMLLKTKELIIKQDIICRKSAFLNAAKVENRRNLACNFTPSPYPMMFSLMGYPAKLF
jgi:hypothetical protein